MGQSQGDLSHFAENQIEPTDVNNEYGRHLPPINASNHIASNHKLENKEDVFYHQRSRSSINFNNNYETISNNSNDGKTFKKYDYSEPYNLINNITTEKKRIEKNTTVKKLVTFKDEVIGQEREENGIKINYIPYQSRSSEYKSSNFEESNKNSSHHNMVYEMNNPKTEVYERIINNNLELSKTKEKKEIISTLNNSVSIKTEKDSNLNNKLYSSYAYVSDVSDSSKEKLKKAAYLNNEPNQSYRLDQSLNKDENNNNNPVIRYIPQNNSQKTDEINQKVEKVSYTQQINGNYTFPEYKLISSEVKIIPITTSLSNSGVKTINGYEQDYSSGHLTKSPNLKRDAEKSENTYSFPQQELLQKIQRIQTIDQISNKIKETPKMIAQKVENDKEETIEIKDDCLIPAKINLNTFVKRNIDENNVLNDLNKTSVNNLEYQKTLLLDQINYIDKPYDKSIDLMANESKNLSASTFDETFKFNQNGYNSFFFNSKTEDSNLKRGGDHISNVSSNSEENNFIISKPIPNKLNPFKAIADFPINQLKEINKEEEEINKESFVNFNYPLKIDEKDKNEIQDNSRNSNKIEGIVFKSHYGCLQDESHYKFSFSLNDSNSFNDFQKKNNEIKNNNKQEKINENPIYETLRESNVHYYNSFETNFGTSKVDEFNFPFSSKIELKNSNISSNTDLYQMPNEFPLNQNKNEDNSKLEEKDDFFSIKKKEEIKSPNILPPLFISAHGLEENNKNILDYTCTSFDFEPKLKLIEAILENSLKTLSIDSNETPIESSFRTQKNIKVSEEETSFKENKKIEMQFKNSIENDEIGKIQISNKIFEAIENFISNNSKKDNLIQSDSNEKKDAPQIDEKKKLIEVFEVKKIAEPIDLNESNQNMPFNLESSKNDNSRKTLTMVPTTFLIDYPSKQTKESNFSKITFSSQINNSDNSIKIESDTSIKKNDVLGRSHESKIKFLDTDKFFEPNSKKLLHRKFQSLSFTKNPLIINVYESQEEEEEDDDFNLNKKITQSISTIKPFKIVIKNENTENDLNNKEKYISDIEIRRHSSTKFNPLELIETDTISEENSKENEDEITQVESLNFTLKKKKSNNYFQKLKKQKQKERSGSLTINSFKWVSFDPTKKKKKSYFKCLKSSLKEQRFSISEIELDINYERWDRFNPVQKSSKKKNYFAKMKSNKAEQKRENKPKIFKNTTPSQEIDTTHKTQRTSNEQDKIKNENELISYKYNPANECRRLSNQEEFDINYKQWDSFDPSKKPRKKKLFFCAEQAKKKQRIISNKNQTFLLVEEHIKKLSAFEIMPKKRKSFFKNLRTIKQNERKNRWSTGSFTFSKKTHKSLKLDITDEENSEKINNLLILKKIEENIDNYQIGDELTPTMPNREENYYNSHEEENNEDYSFFSPTNKLSEIEQISPFRDFEKKENNLNEISDNYELVISESPDSKLFFDEEKNCSYNQEKVLIPSSIEVQDVMLNLENYQATEPLIIKMGIPIVFQSKEAKIPETINEEKKSTTTEIDDDGKRFKKLGKYAEIARKLERIFQNKDPESEEEEVKEMESPENEESILRKRVSFLDYLSEKIIVNKNDMKVIIEEELPPLILPKRKKPTRKQFNDE